DVDAVGGRLLRQLAVDPEPVDGRLLGLDVLGDLHRVQGRGQTREVELADLDLAPDPEELVLEVITGGGNLSRQELQHDNILSSITLLGKREPGIFIYNRIELQR